MNSESNYVTPYEGLQGARAHTAATAKNTGANPFSLRSVHWVLLHALHMGQTDLRPIRRTVSIHCSLRNSNLSGTLQLSKSSSRHGIGPSKKKVGVFYWADLHLHGIGFKILFRLFSHFFLFFPQGQQKLEIRLKNTGNSQRPFFSPSVSQHTVWTK